MSRRKEERIDKEVERKEEHIIAYLQDLVKIRTFVPPGENYGKIVDYLLPLFEKLKFKCEKIEMPRDIYEERQKRGFLKGKRVNLLASKYCDAKKTLIIYTHLDVVPPGAGDGWSEGLQPFDAVVKGDRIYGRGTADSKGAVASLLTALELMDEKEIKSEYNLVVALTTDEEIGPYSGLCFLADAGILQGDYFLSMDGDNDGIGVATNGTMNWEITVYGRSCHSSMPFLGVNAIKEAMFVLQELMEMKKKVENKESKAPCSPYMEEKTGQKHIKPVFNVTMIKGGVKENIIPTSCTLRGDRRYIPEEDAEEVKKEFGNIVEEIKKKHGVELKWSCYDVYPPMFTDPDNKWIKEVCEKASEAFKVDKKIGGAQGSLDVAYAIQRIKPLAYCFFGVGSAIESYTHAADENVKIADLRSYTEFLINLLALNK